MDAHGRADAAKIAAFHVIGIVGPDHDQSNQMMRRLADGFDRGQPGHLVHQKRQGLRGEEWLFRQRQQMKFGWWHRGCRQLALVRQDFAFD